MQCCIDPAGTTLHRTIVLSVLFKYVEDNMAQKKNTCAMSVQGCTDMSSQGNKLYNVVLIFLSQYCTGKLPVQCWSTVHKQLCTEK